MKNWITAMMFGLLMLVGGVASAEEHQVVRVPQKQESKYRGDIDGFYRCTGPDIDLQIGGGYHWDTADKNRDTGLGMGRLRVGVLHIPRWPWAFSVGITGELNTISTMDWGLQGEVLHLGSGLWLRAGASADYFLRPHANAAIGYSLFGFEVQ